MLESNGAAVVITEPESSGNRLFETVSNLLINDKKRMAMAAAAKALCVENATEKICDIVLELVK